MLTLVLFREISMKISKKTYFIAPSFVSMIYFMKCIHFFIIIKEINRLTYLILTPVSLGKVPSAVPW